VQRVRAYAERHFDGNLLELIQPYGFKGVKKDDRYFKKQGLWWVLRHMIRPRLVNPFKMALLRNGSPTCAA